MILGYNCAPPAAAVIVVGAGLERIVGVSPDNLNIIVKKKPKTSVCVLFEA